MQVWFLWGNPSPAWGKTCFKCGKPNHLSRCRCAKLTFRQAACPTKERYFSPTGYRAFGQAVLFLAHIPFVPCQSTIPFLRYGIFKIWPSKSKVKVLSEWNVESHNMGPPFYRLTSLSFHVNRPSHSWDMTFFSKFDLENPRSRSWFRSKLKVTKGV